MAQVQPIKIAVVTGSRAEYGALYWILKEIQKIENFKLQLIVTGAHLSSEFGLTYQFIERDGFHIDRKVEIPLLSDEQSEVAKAIGHITIGMAQAFHELTPTLLIVPGDRYEMLAVVGVALVMGIPVAHLAGGDTTEGAFDESIRHSITKMSHFHFVSNASAAQRVRQLGENPKHIFNIGSPALDHISRFKFLSRNELEKDLGIKFQSKNLLIAFHPETLSRLTVESQWSPLFRALGSFNESTTLVFTKANSDPGGRIINQMIDHFVQNRKSAYVFESLGQLRYLSLLAQVDLIVGNSLKKPAVNIGDRQKGRVQAASVLNCLAQQDEITEAIQKAFDLNCSHVTNPYGDGQSSKRMIEILKFLLNDGRDLRGLLKKHFFDLKTMISP
jgi:UDP-hydrolysing UDP-N-acetyl-D-glucosamine 2-epimerase